MNAMSNLPGPGDGSEPDIVLLGFERKSFYLYRGDDHLNQILLADGNFPTPILCVHFADIFAAKALLGADFTLADLWGIHPTIVTRLRESDALVETDA